jgi:hypothetical protein
MQDLHLIIQISMGWENRHLFEFSDRKSVRQTIRVVEDKAQDDEWDFQPRAFQADRVKLKEEFYEKRAKKPFFYTYDFGDDWIHQISFEEVLEKDLTYYTDTPMCIEAEGVCPPEDIGGIGGFTEFYNTVNDPKSNEGQGFRTWVGLKKGESWNFRLVQVWKFNYIFDLLFSRHDYPFTYK